VEGTLENPIDLGAEGARFSRNLNSISQAKGQSNKKIYLFCFVLFFLEPSLFLDGWFLFYFLGGSFL